MCNIMENLWKTYKKIDSFFVYQQGITYAPHSACLGRMRGVYIIWETYRLRIRFAISMPEQATS